ncbi:MAG: hypothetical protein LBS64_01245, partial [Spirochaetaceae bacterium]|nr:hypothetical protein [Spirochaetaceae bacterium]
MISQKNVFYAVSKSGMLSLLNSVTGLQVMAGCTLSGEFPAAALMIRDSPIEEMRVIERHDRFVDFGSAVTLSEILAGGKRRLPPVFYEAAQ